MDTSEIIKSFESQDNLNLKIWEKEEAKINSQPNSPHKFTFLFLSQILLSQD
jgi:hypothetical protein